MLLSQFEQFLWNIAVNRWTIFKDPPSTEPSKYSWYIQKCTTGLKQTWEIGRFSMTTRRYRWKAGGKKSLRNKKSC